MAGEGWIANQWQQLLFLCRWWIVLFNSTLGQVLDGWWCYSSRRGEGMAWGCLNWQMLMVVWCFKREMACFDAAVSGWCTHTPNKLAPCWHYLLLPRCQDHPGSFVQSTLRGELCVGKWGRAVSDQFNRLTILWEPTAFAGEKFEFTPPQREVGVYMFLMLWDIKKYL